MSRRVPYCLDSQFKAGNRIYGDPTTERIQLPNHSLKDVQDSVMDFSMRRSSRSQQHHSDQLPRRGAARSKDQMPVDLLDLTIKPSGFGGSGRSGGSSSSHDQQAAAAALMYGARGGLGNIPMSNPIMEKLGLQLTSEVTLFPSPSYVGKVKENKSNSSAKGSSPLSTSSASVSSLHQQHQGKMSTGSSGGGRTKSIRSPASSMSSQSSSQVIQGASSAAGGRASASPRHHHISHPHMYPNHLNAKPIFGHPGVSPGTSGAGSSSSAITIKPMASSASSSAASEEKQALAKMKELEKAYQSIPQAFLPGGHAAAPHAPSPFSVGGLGLNAPKMDPTYLTLLAANPFLMSPQAQALMSIPGAMEQFQMYKDLFQQTGLGQFPLHWPPGGGGPPGNERGSK